MYINNADLASEKYENTHNEGVESEPMRMMMECS